MFNLLPEDEKQEIMKEYSYRRLIVVCGFLFVLAVIASVSLFPSFLLSSVRVSEVETQITAVKQSRIFKEAKVLENALIDTNEKISILKNKKNSILVGDVILNILDNRGASIRLAGFLYKKGTNEGEGSLIISGIARDRDSLSGFVKSLEEISDFSSVNLPVSNFTRERDAEFTIEITGNF